jgi:hypothetical protein
MRSAIAAIAQPTLSSTERPSWEGIRCGSNCAYAGSSAAPRNCGQRIFTRRLPKTAQRHTRRTCPLSASLEQIALALGGARRVRVWHSWASWPTVRHFYVSCDARRSRPLRMHPGVGHRRLGVAQRALLRHDSMRSGTRQSGRSVTGPQCREHRAMAACASWHRNRQSR